VLAIDHVNLAKFRPDLVVALELRVVRTPAADGGREQSVEQDYTVSDLGQAT
jgi:hypothetical protein